MKSDRVVRYAAALTYYAMMSVGYLILWTPYLLKSALASFVTVLWWDLLKFRRRIVLNNLSVVFARNSEETMQHYRVRLERTGRASIFNACLGIFEIIERFAWTEKTVRARVRPHNFQVLSDLSQKGEGYFILTSHLGAWELATFSGVAMGLRLAVITRFLRSRFWDRIWVRSRKRFGLRLLGESYSGRAVVRSVREGYGVGFMMDQHTGRPHGILTQFLGMPAWSPKGLAILSRALKVPIIEVYMLRDGKGGYDLHVAGEVSPCAESGVDKEEDVALHVKLCNEKMEAWIRRYPEQYLWLHRRFKNTVDYRRPLPWEAHG